ncbi:MAG: F0F1 ATP synthase subunit epsilon [Candidatus Paceibacterota bacterium]
MLVKVITPEKELFNKKAKSVNLPTLSGYITILPHHTELISIIHKGQIKIEFEDETKTILSEGGIVEVFKNEVSLLLTK